MRKKQILVVEDNAIIGMDIAEHLKQMEYDVIDVVATGEEAILRANATHPDLILMDIHLDGAMDGTEAARRINARFDIPIIYITAYSDEETLASANRVFSYGYIIKPFGEKQLMCAIGMAFSNHALHMKLKAHDYWLNKTLTSIGDGVISTNRRGEVTFLNRRGRILLGLQDREVSELPLADILSIRDAAGRQIPLDSLPDAVEQQEFFCSPSGGKSFPIELTVTKLFDEQQQYSGIVAIFRDISERMAANRALDESEEKFRSLFENIGDAGFLIEISDNGRKNTIIQVNNAACALLGYSYDELAGKEMGALNDICCNLNFPGYMHELIEQGSVRYEMVLVSKGGKRSLVEINARLFMVQERPMVISLAHPISL